MRIEAGKSYKAANGERVGPMEFWAGNTDRLRQEPGDGKYWMLDGTGKGAAWGNDLVAEWSEGPVRTVIGDGLYGIVAVYREQDQVRVTLTREDGTPDQLEAAARTLQQLAEALREG